MKSRGRKIFIGMIFRNAYTILNIVLAFFMMPFILHHLGDRMYGLWVLMGSFMGYMGFLDLGLADAVGRFINRAIGLNNKGEVNEIVNTAFIIYLFLSLIVLITTVILMINAAIFVKNVQDLYIVRILILCIGLNLFFSFPVRAFGGLIRAHLEYKFSESILIFELIARYGLILIFFNFGFGIISLGIIVSGVAIFSHVLWALIAFHVDKDLRLDFKCFKRHRVRELFGYSFFSFISRIAGSVISKTDAFVISATIGLAQNAHYAIPVTLMNYLYGFLCRMIGLVGPVFSQDDGRGAYDALKHKFYLVTKISVLTVAFFGLMAILYGKEFIVRWVGSEYLDAYPVLIVMSAMTIISTALVPATSLLFQTSRHRFVALASSIEAVSNLILSLILVRFMGMIGVALGTLIPIFFIRLVVQPWYLNRTLGISPKRFYVDILFRNFMLALVGVLPVYLILNSFSVPHYGVLFMIGCVHLCIASVLVYKFGFTNDERKYLANFIAPLRKTNNE